MKRLETSEVSKEIGSRRRVTASLELVGEGRDPGGGMVEDRVLFHQGLAPVSRVCCDQLIMERQSLGVRVLHGCGASHEEFM